MKAMWRRPGRDESGSALIIALIIMTVTVTLSLAAANEALHGASTTQLDRNRIQAVSVAEAGIDYALSQLQGQEPPPCSLTVPTLASAPVTGTASVTLTYYDTYPPSGDPDGSCAAGFPGGNPAALEIESTGKIGGSSVGEQKMEALVQLSPYLADAIYANSLSINNNVVLSGQVGVGDNANVYVQGSPSTTVTCADNGDIHGSLYVQQGSVSLSNNCQVHGAVWAGGNVSAAPNTQVDGLISSTTEDIDFQGTHAGGALAHGSVTPACPNPVFGTCAAQASVGNVPQEPFPVLTESAAETAFTQEGYALVLATSCDQLDTYVPTVNTVFVLPPSCGPLTLGNSATMTTNADLAVIAPNGITTNNSFTWESGDGATHKLYLIVPDVAPGSTPLDCSTGDYDVNFKNNASFVNLDAVIYTPCNLIAKNNPVSTGQLYVNGNLQINNNFSMTFQPESLPGATGGVAYNAAVAYERQITG